MNTDPTREILVDALNALILRTAEELPFTVDIDETERLNALIERANELRHDIASGYLKIVINA
jgi:hypothetical protein